MKRIIYSLTIFSLILCSCEEMLNTKLTNQWSEEDMWMNANMAQGVLLSVYDNVMVAPDKWDGNFLDAATDNAITRNNSSSVYRVGQGGLSYNTNPIGIWTNTYNQLQKIHQFLDKGLRDELKYSLIKEEDDLAIKARLEGEAYFLRAWCGFLLLQMYGGKTDSGEALGYPIVTSFVTAEEAADIASFKRNTYEECVEQICSDCDKAMGMLPMTYTGDSAITGKEMVGRACGLAAAALKSRVLLYAASPAYQPDSIVTMNEMGSYTVVNESAYVEKWKRAADWAAQVIALPDMGAYKALNAKELCDGGDNQSTEFLFRTFVGRTNGLESRHYPPFYYGNAQTIPSQNLVDAFPAKNGYPVSDPRSGYDPDAPYSLERDKRMSINVFWHGRKFGNNDSAIDVSNGGKDSHYFNEKASRTGYYLAKFMNTDAKDFLKPLYTQDSRHYYPMIRKAEVWYNYAEAANEAWGPDGKSENATVSAYDVIKNIRSVSGGITSTEYLDEMKVTKESFRELILNERRIEFAFENHRFWDLRRCLLPLNETITGMQVERTDGTDTFNVVEVEERPLNDTRFYYMPLPFSEMQKNPELKNNKGWN